MWLVMGFIFQELFFPIGIVGFCGCLYYLFKAYEIVSPIKDGVDPAAELVKVDKEIEDNA
ncbi:MAG: hypothetical protein AWT59_3240 [Candidatus Gallionella acididurans]|uniref:Uncharacterized protein n=1 Tax=Candidatus Gallionella acididurans TaxID=1796491 RepID=A0A139BNQ6_9PROT|nr:MAG: hypothetical protein AWT59_3240 [Candidatus Gallionella acididurans]